NGEEGEKSVAMGEGFAGKAWRDYLNHRDEILTADEQGTVVVRCNGGSVSVWVLAE
ncbi:MAG: alpha-amylase, partial [Pantoea sp.]|nr:alpha-amylase [Pantoea sp.]